MKKSVSILLCLTLAFSLCSCTDSKQEQKENTSENESGIITEGGITEKDGVQGVELPDIIVTPDDKGETDSGTENPDSAVSSDGTVTVPDSSGEQTEEGSSGSSEGSEGTSTPSNPGSNGGIELPEYEF